MSEKADEITRLVMQLGHSLTSHFESELAELELTFPQALLLRQLGDALPMNQAAGRMHCDPSNVTGIVDRLEARGLIKRTQGTDRRVKHLVLTAEGRRLKRRVDALLADVPGVASLSASDQTTLRDLLRRSLELKRELDRGSLEEWLDEVAKHPISSRPGISAAQAVREAREERADQLARVGTHRHKKPI